MEDPVEGSALVTFDYMQAFMMATFRSYGLGEEDAAVATDVLLEADKRGISSHGIGRLKPIYCDRIDAGIMTASAPISVVRDSGAVALVDGNMGLGLTVGPHCMKLAIAKAKEFGVGLVVAQRSTHYGIAGYYATMATEAGCVGFSTTNARPSIAPTFGVEGMMGTNPLCFGIPTDEAFPFVIDCATSVNQRGKIERYAREGRDTPKGQVIDLEGNERTDTEGILRDLALGKAALCPVGGAGDSMGGYKGYGWAAAVELLCTAFQRGPFGEALAGVDRATGERKPMPLGHVFLAIDVGAVSGDEAAFRAHAGAFLRAVRASAKDPRGPGRIWTAGEPENDAREHLLARRPEAGGSFYIPPALQKDMRELRDGRFSEEQQQHFATFPWEEEEEKEDGDGKQEKEE